MSNQNPRPNVRMTPQEYREKLVQLGAPNEVLQAWDTGNPNNHILVFNWVMNNVVGR